MAMKELDRYVILVWDGRDGWAVEEESDDHTAATISFRYYRDDAGKTVRFVDTQEEF